MTIIQARLPRVHDTAVGVFHRVKRGTYKLSTTGRRRAGVVGALHLQRADQLRRCGFDEDQLRGVEIAFGKAGQRLLIIERVVFQASEPGE